MWQSNTFLFLFSVLLVTSGMLMNMNKTGNYFFPFEIKAIEKNWEYWRVKAVVLSGERTTRVWWGVCRRAAYRGATCSNTGRPAHGPRGGGRTAHNNTTHDTPKRGQRQSKKLNHLGGVKLLIGLGRSGVWVWGEGVFWSSTRPFRKDAY